MIVLKNREIIDPEYNEALALLLRHPLPAAAAWELADLLKKSQEIMDRVFTARRETGLRYGARPLPNGDVTFLPDAAMPPECKKELTDLDEIENSIDFKPVKLPERRPDGSPILYEPIIMSRLTKLLTR
jgi:hypothetical protein